MASREEKTHQEVSKSKILWKLLPEFFRRKKSDRNCVKKKTEETVSVRELMLTQVTPSNTDSLPKKDEPEFKTNEAKNIEENISSLCSKKTLRCRKSLTYGQCYNCDRIRHNTAADMTDNDITFEKKSRGHSLHRPLYREKSCHQRNNPEYLTKNEARKRLLSWQKTTIVRKNSEQQQQQY